MLFRAVRWGVTIAVAVLAACGGGGGPGTGPGRDAGFDDPPDINPDISHACDPGPNTFFVSPTGNDGADGLSMATSWKTLAGALTKLTAGQTACIAPGEYTGALSIAKVGSAGQFISLVGLDPDRAASIIGETQIQGTSRFVRLANLKLRHPSRSGEALVILGASNVQLINIEVVDSNKMWWRSVDNILLRDSWIHHNVIGIDCTPGPCNNVAIVGTIVECSGFTTSENCRAADSFVFGGRSDGVGAEADTNNWTVIRSIFRNNQTDGFDVKGSNITVIDSMAYGNAGGGFKIWGGGMTTISNSVAFHNNNGVELQEAAGAQYKLINVTSADNHLAGLAVYSDNGSHQTLLDVRNSIFAGNDDGNTFDDSVILSGTCNVYFADESRQIKGGDREYTLQDVLAGLTPDTSALGADPLFVSPDSGNDSDYSLRAGSPAINSGTADLAPMTDIAGRPRPSGGGIDRGAYEAQ